MVLLSHCKINLDRLTVVMVIGVDILAALFVIDNIDAI